jgi:hypothetical protein
MRRNRYIILLREKTRRSNQDVDGTGFIILIDYLIELRG